MKLRVITEAHGPSHEVETISALLDKGAVLHVRKPGWSNDRLEQWLQPFTSYRDQLHVHGAMEVVQMLKLKGVHLTSKQALEAYHQLEKPHNVMSKSFHSTQEIEEEGQGYDYVFLSPVFDSISKHGYASKFDHQELRLWLSRPGLPPVFALGGIDENTLHLAVKMGFSGAAVLGSLWQKDSMKERIEIYEKLNQICQRSTC